MFKVGPESASAHPGPACYRKGGPLTLTDANLVLRRLRPEYFPKIFGPNEYLTLDVDASRKLFEELTVEINKEIEIKLWRKLLLGKRPKSWDENVLTFV
jgi:5-oxoprolinase (ATP-hydrolysing)